jgi:hypothetical protein
MVTLTRYDLTFHVRCLSSSSLLTELLAPLFCSQVPDLFVYFYNDVCYTMIFDDIQFGLSRFIYTIVLEI